MKTWQLMEEEPILIANMSHLQIKNCTFTNNGEDKVYGVGGAIASLQNSLLDVSFTIFDHNKARTGAAIHQDTSKSKLNQCLFFSNSETAISGLINSELTIINSIFQNNLAKHIGGAVNVDQSVLNVSKTTFKNNSHISASKRLNVYQSLFNETLNGVGGGAICLMESCWIHF